MHGYVLGAALLAAAAPTIYTWTDAEGRRHYADRPPEDEAWIQRTVETDRLSSYSAPAAPVDPARRDRADDASDSDAPRSGRSKASATTRREERRQRCEALLADIDEIQDQLRRGYREPRGRQLRDRRRALQDRYRERCI